MNRVYYVRSRAQGVYRGLLVVLIGGLVLGGGSGSAAASDGAALFKSKGCPACHGVDGSYPVSQDYPVIAGQNASYLLRQSRDIRDGRRNNGLTQMMREAVTQVTDDELAIISEWLALQ